MKLNQTIILFLCAAGMAFISGCYYLRLQETKNQLANFDKYYIIEDSNQFSISAKKPTLCPDDVIRIFKSEPAAKEQTTTEMYYDYILEKQYQAEKNEQGDYNIKLRFVFVKDKLNKLLIDERLFAIIPKNAVIALAKALGSAKVDMQKRSFSLTANAGHIHLPDADEVVASLGKPSWQKDNRYVYNYLRNSPNAKNASKNIQPADFVFDKDGNCVRCRSRAFGIPFEMDIEKPLPSDANTSADAEACSDGQPAQIKINIKR
ncbi:MAG TPA: hypothetical protein DDW84_05510 [Phycisphaerales bacterium]|nr:MAG: hypothetical protein A2Y13_06585 [Planctomycetes bacterium GWC2_45_44]HBG78290.1 hypothetical protein [Phycisphaerales bacterium]HBR18843.1 hypothetical protein [Phycisphaerales bacterium]